MRILELEEILVIRKWGQGQPYLTFGCSKIMAIAKNALGYNKWPHLFYYSYVYQPNFEFLALNLKLNFEFFSSKFTFQPLLLDC